MEPKLKLSTCTEVEHYCGNTHLLRHRSKHTAAFAIYYQVGLLTKALQCEERCAINMKQDPTLLDAGYLILL